MNKEEHNRQMKRLKITKCIGCGSSLRSQRTYHNIKDINENIVIFWCHNPQVYSDIIQKLEVLE